MEPQRGTFNWTPVDRVVNAIVNHGMRPLGVLAYTPAWARDSAANDLPGAPANHRPPANPADYAAFAAQAASRFATTINDWEIWNEPNSSAFWVPAPNADAYTRLLVAAAAAIRAVKSDANIIAGAMAPGEDWADGEIDPLTFVQRMYAAGGKNAFNTLSIHPYTYPSMPTDASTSNWSTFQKIPRIHDVMQAQGDGAKPVWITEYGAPTGSDSTSVSRDVQATYLKTGINAARGLGYVPVILVYSIRDSGTNPSDPEQNFGLLTRGFERKPAYDAVLNMAKIFSC